MMLLDIIDNTNITDIIDIIDPAATQLKLLKKTFIKNTKQTISR